MKLRDDVTLDGEVMDFGGGRGHYSFWRGDGTTFYPTDDDLRDRPVQIIAKGMPAEPFVTLKSQIVAFGSCFADNISHYLNAKGYHVATKKDKIAHISSMGDGIVNTYAVLQQLEWAWENRVPKQELWHGYDAKSVGYDEEVRLATRALLDTMDVFIITFGLSEIWYDEPTGEVFWRAVPADKFDPARHKFRVATQSENLANLRKIADLISLYRPQAEIIFTLSPIPLTATFRDMSCITANGASKANLRSALDEFSGAHYFPAYELVNGLFNHQFMEDRRHIHYHVIQFMMAVFERFYCGSITDDELRTVYRAAVQGDKHVGAGGHWAVKRKNLKYSKKQ